MSLLFLLRVEQPAIAAVSLALELIQGDEAQRGRVDAVTQTALFRWAIREDVAKMAVAMAGANLSPSHPVTAVGVFHHVFRLEWLAEARPTAVALEFVN